MIAAPSITRATKDALERLAERISNSPRLRAEETEEAEEEAGS